MLNHLTKPLWDRVAVLIDSIMAAEKLGRHMDIPEHHEQLKALGKQLRQLVGEKEKSNDE